MMVRPRPPALGAHYSARGSPAVAAIDRASCLRAPGGLHASLQRGDRSSCCPAPLRHSRAAPDALCAVCTLKLAAAARLPAQQAGSHSPATGRPPPARLPPLVAGVCSRSGARAPPACGAAAHMQWRCAGWQQGWHVLCACALAAACDLPSSQRGRSAGALEFELHPGRGAPAVATPQCTAALARPAAQRCLPEADACVTNEPAAAAERRAICKARPCMAAASTHSVSVHTIAARHAATWTGCAAAQAARQQAAAVAAEDGCKRRHSTTGRP